MRRLLALLLLLLFPVPLLAAAPMTVFAASSMTEAMTAVADGFAATGHPRPVLVLAGTPALARQIVAGAPAGVFVAADTQWMDAVASKLVPGSRRVVATNRLVLVLPAAGARQVALVKGFDLSALVGAGHWTTGDPAAVPVGRYAEAALRSLGAWDAAVPSLVRAENVRAALAYVERGDAVAGIVYATDARASARVAVAGVFPAGSHPPIVYPAATVTAGAGPEATAFLAFLSGPQGRRILKAKGFGLP